MNINVPTRNGPKIQKIGETGASKFSMRGVSLLADGASADPMATAENLWISVKVYSSGGENALHIHTTEDHSFVVMQGKATFHFGDGSSQVARQFEGVMLPKGVSYRFEADEAENLVLLRIGAAQRTTTGAVAMMNTGAPAELKGKTIDADGGLKDASDPKTGTPSRPIVPLPGKFFAQA